MIATQLSCGGSMEGAMKKMQFIINKNGVYYVTTGRLLEYDPAQAKEPKQKEGVEEVKRKFEEIERQPHTWYRSVELGEADFGPLNTGQST
jgi:hypothetical protein